jgi:hypothetical protein
MPDRIQRRRTKGWRMPDGAVYVGRPSKWGNPYVIRGRWVTGLFYEEHLAAVGEERGLAVRLFREHIAAGRWLSHEIIRAELRGKDLVCWCPLDQPCHADVLLEIANA